MNIEKTQIAELLAGTMFHVEVEAADGTIGQREAKANMIPNQGLEYFVGILFDGVTPAADWFIVPYEGNYTPGPTVTAATAPAAATESTAYDETTRVLFNTASAGVGARSNSANKAEFTFNADKTIYGVWVVSASAKGATTGVIISFVRFASPKLCDAGSVLRVTAGFAIASL